MGVKQLVRIWWWVCTVVVLAVSGWMWWSLASDGWATAFVTGQVFRTAELGESNHR